MAGQSQSVLEMENEMNKRQRGAGTGSDSSFRDTMLEMMALQAKQFNDALQMQQQMQQQMMLQLMEKSQQSENAHLSNIKDMMSLGVPSALVQNSTLPACAGAVEIAQDKAEDEARRTAEKTLAKEKVSFGKKVNTFLRTQDKLAHRKKDLLLMADDATRSKFPYGTKAFKYPSTEGKLEEVYSEAAEGDV